MYLVTAICFVGLYAYEFNRDSTDDSRHEVNREQVDSSSDPRVNFDEVQEMINKALSSSEDFSPLHMQ